MPTVEISEITIMSRQINKINRPSKQHVFNADNYHNLLNCIKYLNIK